jgi:hypothetical protein
MDQTEQQYIDRVFDKLRSAESQSGPRDAEAERYIQQLVSRQPSLAYYMTQAVIVQEEALKGAQQRIDDMERELDERPAQGSSGGGGSFLGGLFGGGSNAPAAPARSGSAWGGGGGSVPRSGGVGSARNGQMEQSPLAQYGQQQPNGQPQRGGGFLAGAMQTAAGVAGGVLLGNMLGNMFGGNEAKAGEGAKPGEEGAKPGEEAAKPDAAAEAKPEQGNADQQQAGADQNDQFANVENTQYDDNDSYFGGDDGGGDFDI